MSEQLCWSLLQPQPAAGHGCRVRCLSAGQVHKGPSGEQSHPRGMREPSCTILPGAELSCSPCTHWAAWCCAWAWLMAENHSRHTEGNRKQSSHKKHPVSKPTSSWSQASAAPDPARNQVNCSSAGKTEMHTRFSTDANPLSPEGIPLLVPGHQLCQPLPDIFFSKAYEFLVYFCCIKWAMIK